MKSIVSVCPFCGCGCKLKYIIDNQKKIIKTEGDKKDEISEGKPCIKGLSFVDAIYKDRLTKPAIRENIDEDFEEVSWEEAYDFIYENLKGIEPSKIYFTGSGEFTNESNYLIQKLARVVFRTNNIDCCARLCHAPTVYAFKSCFGTSGTPNFMKDVIDSDLIIAIGTNPLSNYPVFFNMIKKGIDKGTKLITIGVKNVTANFSYLHISPELGTLIILISGFIHEIINDKEIEKKKGNLPGFKELKNSVSKITPSVVSDICKINLEDFNKVVELMKKSKRIVFTHGMGLTQYQNGTQNALSITNLAILLDAKIVCMRGKVNVQGASDMGCCPDFLPFGGSEELTKKNWGVVLEKKEGIKITEALEKIKAFYIMGMNPAQSLPDLNKIHKILRKRFVIYQHHSPSISMKFANVVLPAPMLIEEEGTITNGERRVRYVRKVKDPPGGKQNWEIICDVAKKFGFEKQFNYKSVEEIFNEITKAIPDYANLNYKKIMKRDYFANKNIEYTRLIPITPIACPIERNSKYPFLLTTSRWMHHFCTGEITTKSKLAEFAKTPVAHINEKDAAALGIKDGDLIEISSKAGSIKITAKTDPYV
ncbi:MAG: molybdopterin-dependent oxidoreductase, partial [Candidatus Micrarchaeia archaeon]